MDIKSAMTNFFNKFDGEVDPNKNKEHNDSSKRKSDVSAGASKIANPVHATSGGEMPDPTKMPSQTKFHLNTQDDN
jgi:hypothetical protein